MQDGSPEECASSPTKEDTALDNARLMSVTELAEYLGVKPAWLYNNHRTLNIPGRKIGGHLRFRRADVDRWIERECKPAA
jgi:excisionase family DNA binding protein